MKISISERDKNINIKEFFAESPMAYRSFWQDLCRKYPGYVADFIYQNSEPPIEFLNEINAEVLEILLISSVTPESFTPASIAEVEQVTTDNFDIFAKIHDATNPEDFLSSARLAENMDRWRIFMYGNNYVITSWNETPEVFTLEASDEKAAACLITAAARYTFENRDMEFLFYVEHDNLMHLEAARKVGFVVSGKSIAYRVKCA